MYEFDVSISSAVSTADGRETAPIGPLQRIHHIGGSFSNGGGDTRSSASADNLPRAERHGTTAAHRPPASALHCHLRGTAPDMQDL